RRWLATLLAALTIYRRAGALVRARDGLERARRKARLSDVRRAARAPRSRLRRDRLRQARRPRARLRLGPRPRVPARLGRQPPGDGGARLDRQRAVLLAPGPAPDPLPDDPDELRAPVRGRYAAAA